MKSTTTQLRTHLDQEVTALCTCWIIERVDGTVYRFTDADTDVSQGGQIYKSVGAYRRTAIETTASLSVDNLDIVGATSDLALPEEDLRTGLFDNAKITVFMTPWLASVRGRLKLRRGFFGEVQTIPNNTYQVELRGVLQRLAYTYTDLFSSDCLYDLGEPGCGIIIKPADVQPNTSYVVGDALRIGSGGPQGKYYELGLGDPDFEIIGPNATFDESQFWTNTGATDMSIGVDFPYSGTYYVNGASGAATIVQYIDLENDVGLSENALDTASCYFRLRGWRQDDAGNEGRLQAEFLDRVGAATEHSRQLETDGGFSVTQFGLAGDFTIEMWVYLDPATEIDVNQVLFGQGVLGFGGTGFRLAYESGRLTFREDDDVGGTNSSVVLQSSKLAEEGIWRHVALVRDGSSVTLYEDFKVTATGTYSGTVQISQWGNGPSATGLVGRMDEIRVWDDVRTTQELGLNAYHSVNVGSSNLIRYHHFNDGTLDDQTGNDASSPSLGAGNTISRGLGSPVAARSGEGDGSADYDSGFNDVGTEWTEIQSGSIRIPGGARSVRISYSVQQGSGSTPVRARLDNLTGYIVDTSQTGPLMGFMTGNKVWVVSADGTTGSAPITASGASDSIGPDVDSQNSFLREGRVLKVTGSRSFVCEVSDARAVTGWFNGGGCIFESGENAGATMEVKTWDADTNTIELFLSMPNPIKAGDHFSVYPGCDKSRINCAAIFNNVQNMFAFPDVPGQDELYRYPDANN